MSIQTLLFPNTENMVFTSNTCTSTTQKCYMCKEKCQFSYVNVNLSTTCGGTGDIGIVNYTGVKVLNSLNQSPFTFNEDNYAISAMYLLSPSIGTYGNSENTEYCEFVIQAFAPHSTLNIFIPILVDVGLVDSFDITKGQVNFALKDYIPQNGFVFYSVSNTVRANYIVFPTSSLTISLTTKNLINSGNSNPIANGKYTGPLYYNPNGPGDSPDSSDQIYINCTPTDHSQEASKYTPNTEDIKSYVLPTSWLDKPWLFYVIVFIVTLTVSYFFIKFITMIFSSLAPSISKLTNSASKNKSNKTNDGSDGDMEQLKEGVKQLK